jgi:hypothetical protein
MRRRIGNGRKEAQKAQKNHASLSAAKPQPNRHRILQEATEETEAMAADINRLLNSEF